MKTKNTAATVMEYMLFSLQNRTKRAPVRLNRAVATFCDVGQQNIHERMLAPRRYFDEAIGLIAARLLLPSALYSA
jgi:hypothetical protein